MITNNFDLERGNESDRPHLSVKDYKQITGFEDSKTILKDINLELPDVPNLKTFNKLIIARDEKIEELIIKPKNKLIEQLHKDNLILQEKLNK